MKKSYLDLERSRRKKVCCQISQVHDFLALSNSLGQNKWAKTQQYDEDTLSPSNTEITWTVPNSCTKIIQIPWMWSISKYQTRWTHHLKLVKLIPCIKYQVARSHIKSQMAQSRRKVSNGMKPCQNSNGTKSRQIKWHKAASNGMKTYQISNGTKLCFAPMAQSPCPHELKLYKASNAPMAQSSRPH